MLNVIKKKPKLKPMILNKLMLLMEIKKMDKTKIIKGKIICILLYFKSCIKIAIKHSNKITGAIFNLFFCYFS